MSVIKKHPKAVSALVMAVALVVVINVFRADQPPKAVQEVFSTLYRNWTRQAEQLGNVLDKGARVVVLDFERSGDREYGHVIAALQETGVTLEHIERLVVDEDAGWDSEKPGFPYFEFVRAADAHPGVDAVISFCGLPYFSPGAQRPNPSELPKLLVVGLEGDDVFAKPLFAQGRLYALSVPRTVYEEGRQVVSYDLLRGE